ncbi:MAG TPA: hypothetical protein VFR86_17915 [Burkholderiaceae bacterium]|nr:hypothetical protein [Burkholderiaceae bacterium]
MIERRLAMGVRQRAIIRELAAEGHPTTPLSFRNALLRARRAVERDANGSRVLAQARASATQPAGVSVGGIPRNLFRASFSAALVERAATVLPDLSRPAGFHYPGTKDIPAEDLI